MSESKIKRLYRSRKDKVIAGVCGGLAEYFDLDPVVFRIIFVVLLIAGGSGVLIYIILAIVIPQEPEIKSKKDEKPDYGKQAESAVNDVKESFHNNSSRNLIGLIIILIGIFALANVFLPVLFNWKIFWAFMIIVFGVYLLLSNKNR